MRLKQGLVNFDMLTTFLFGVSSNLSQQKSPTAEIIGTDFLGTISPVEHFCCDKFEETPNEKMVNISKLTKSYFNKCIHNSYCNYDLLYVQQDVE